MKCSNRSPGLLLEVLRYINILLNSAEIVTAKDFTGVSQVGLQVSIILGID